MVTNVTNIEELVDGTLIGLREVGREVQATTADGRDVTNLIRKFVRAQAHREGMALRFIKTTTGGYQFRKAQLSEFTAAAASLVKVPAVSEKNETLTTTEEQTVAAMTPDEVAVFLTKCYALKPNTLVLSELKWKFLIRSVLRGKNLLMTGPSGAGKTLAVQVVKDVLRDRQYFYFNLGATQDPRTALIGNTHFRHGEGTFHVDSLFVQAIQIPNAIILLDELSRAHPEAANILMTVLDYNQRYLRIDEKQETPTIKVAPGVCFIATANIGAEYTAARVMDRALLERFTRLEMDLLSVDDELALLKLLYPDVDGDMLKALAEIAGVTRKEVKSDAPKIRQEISTRLNVEAAAAIQDGFTLADVAEAFIYPYYDTAGGQDSERTFMKQLVQKHMPTALDNKARPGDDDSIPTNKLPFDI